MSALLLLTNALQPSAEVLPGLALLGHQVKILPAEGSALLEAPEVDLLLVDGRLELAHARDLCRLIRTTGTDVPVLLVVTEGGLSVVAHDWGMDDIVLHTCGPAELEAPDQAGHRTDQGPPRGRRPRVPRDPVRRGRGRRRVVHRQDRRPLARPDVQGVRAAEVPRPAPRPGLQPPAAAPGGVGLRLLRRHPHRRRARTPPARQARPRERDADRHGPQRRLPLRDPGRSRRPPTPTWRGTPRTPERARSVGRP